MTVKDHNYIIGKDDGLSHQKRNLNLRLTKKIPFVFHNLQSQYSHLLFQEIDKYYLKINILPKAMEKCMSFTIEKTKTSFELDSAHYLSTLGYSWDVILKFSYSNLELISVIEIHQFIESTLRGFISITF